MDEVQKIYYDILLKKVKSPDQALLLARCAVAMAVFGVSYPADIENKLRSLTPSTTSGSGEVKLTRKSILSNIDKEKGITMKKLSSMFDLNDEKNKEKFDRLLQKLAEDNKIIVRNKKVYLVG